MIALGSLALLRPLWLFVPLALLLLLRATRCRDELGDWRQAVDAPLLAAMLRRQGGVGIKRRDGPLFCSIALIALALSGPAVKSANADQFRNLDATVILLDVSRETLLPQAVAAAQLVLARSRARQIGLVLYAGDAYLASPLTDDAAALEALLFAIDEETVPDGGVRPDRAIAFVRHLLREAAIVEGDVVLISDGAGVVSQATGEALSLAVEGYALHTLLVAPRAAANPFDAPRRAAMTTLAVSGRGLAGDAARAEDITARIASRRIEHITQGALRSLEWRDYGRFLLPLAAVPFFLYLGAFSRCENATKQKSRRAFSREVRHRSRHEIPTKQRSATRAP